MTLEVPVTCRWVVTRIWDGIVTRDKEVLKPSNHSDGNMIRHWRIQRALEAEAPSAPEIMQFSGTFKGKPPILSKLGMRQFRF